MWLLGVLNELIHPKHVVWHSRCLINATTGSLSLLELRGRNREVTGQVRDGLSWPRRASDEAGSDRGRTFHVEGVYEVPGSETMRSKGLQWE